MKKFFVIGSNASKSLSPLIFNYWFKKYKLDAKYSFVQTAEKDFGKTLTKQLKDKKVCGFNITIPFKKKIIKHVDFTNTHAKKIGAINCVSIGKKIKGTNTDWVGYLSSIKSLKLNKNKKILILGYGGASQAIIYGLLTKGFNKIEIFNRTKKAVNIKKIKKYTKKYSSIENHLSDTCLIINTTPINPLNKKQSKMIKTDVVVSDIVYKPKETNFIKSFTRNKKIYGISMLIEQAIPCFYLWFGFRPEIDRPLLKKLNEKTQ